MKEKKKLQNVNLFHEHFRLFVGFFLDTRLRGYDGEMERV
jgi:hypothetical protein